MGSQIRAHPSGWLEAFEGDFQTEEPHLLELLDPLGCHFQPPSMVASRPEGCRVREVQAGPGDGQYRLWWRGCTRALDVGQANPAEGEGQPSRAHILQGGGQRA